MERVPRNRQIWWACLHALPIATPGRRAVRYVMVLFCGHWTERVRYTPPDITGRRAVYRCRLCEEAAGPRGHHFPRDVAWERERLARDRADPGWWRRGPWPGPDLTR